MKILVIEGIGPVHTAKRVPQHLRDRLAEVNKAKNLVIKMPGINQVAH